MKLMASTGRQKPAGQILVIRMARSPRRVPCTRIVQRGTLVLPDFRYFGTCMSPEPRGVGEKVNDEKRQGPARFSSVGRYAGRRSSHSSPSSPRAWASSLERPNSMGTGHWALGSGLCAAPASASQSSSSDLDALFAPACCLLQLEIPIICGTSADDSSNVHDCRDPTIPPRSLRRIGKGWGSSTGKAPRSIPMATSCRPTAPVPVAAR